MMLWFADPAWGQNPSSQTLPRLKVSDNARFLVQEDGPPFFWLGDTAWELFHRLSREEATKYLDLRQEQGFTVIQAVAIAELDGNSVPNAYGFLPFTDPSGTTPAVKEGDANDYWDHVDWITAEANRRGMYIGFLPTWGRYWKNDRIFRPENAEQYGEWLGKRYQNSGIIWILGGDRNVENDTERETLTAMASGLRRGDHGAHLITFHPCGGQSSSRSFHDAPWLDFNMRQNGHNTSWASYAPLTEDYQRTPTKPVLDGEPLYEDHPNSFDPDQQGHSIAADVRRPLYWDLFAGAFGHTYGHHSVWQMYDPARDDGVNRPLMPWYEAIHQPGASQMRYGKALMESRPFLTRIPDDSILVPEPYESAVPGRGLYHLCATRDTNRTWAFVYTPTGRKFSVWMNCIQGDQVRAAWYNPRTGESTVIGFFSNKGKRTFAPPTPGEMLDWVLILDDVAAHYPL